MRYVSAFYNDKVDVVPPKNYILIQGNFDVEENKYAVDFLLKELIPICPDQNFVFAGKNADKYIVQDFKNVTVVNSPSKTQMYSLNNEARASIVYSNLNAGVKLKILNSLAAGVPVFCNSNLHIDPYLKLNIQQYSNGLELAKLIQNSDRSTSSRVERQKSFLATFNLKHPAQKIINYLID